MNTFLSFIITCLIIESTPGPNMAYLAILSLGNGRRAGFFAVAGIACGLLAIGLVAAFGVATLITNSPLAYQALRWCGVFYLLWLAWEGWSAGKEKLRENENEDIEGAKFFRRGLITNLLNPKAAVFYIAVLPAFIDSSFRILAQTVTLTFVYVTIATAIHLLIVVMASSARAFFVNPDRMFFVRRILSLLLAAVAVWFAFATHNS